MPTKQKPASGGLIKLRGRRWVVLPNRDEDILSITPLGGSDKEATGIYLPLLSPGDEWKEDKFPDPTLSDLNDFATAKVLFDAARLSFRNAAGPFRCAGKLSFRPRSYQMVPLIMALKQEKVRLLIADDVGIGKTIEALLIIREMMERGEIKNFAVVCPPHLCEQWNQEIRDKLGLESVVIRSSTVRALERQISNDNPVFVHFPYQVISIDYLKTSNRKPSFIAHCPDLVIVDEAHTCALPAGAKSTKQQQRHDLLVEMIKEKDPHLLLLTATPHSGKNEEFSSLIGLLNPEFGKWDLENVGQQERRRLARHFILRKRENIKHWLKQDTPFPERDSTELAYHLSPAYLQVFESARELARQLSTDGNETHLRGKYWAALALLRGIMSSPAAGSRMVRNKLQKNVAKALEGEASPTLELTKNPLIETAESQNDVEDTALLEEVYLSETQRKRLREMDGQLEKLHGLEHDTKAAAALKLVREWLKAGFHPIVFCHYKATADYLGEILSRELGKKTQVRVLTSDLVDEQRRQAVDELALFPSRVLVATDCLSEGINLQEHFTAVLHYDLPWNPNRLEQREGRVDRYGQSAPVIKTSVLYGIDNPMDETVMEVLLRKVREIQRTTGVSITLGEENSSIMDAVLKKVLLAEPSSSNIQHRLDLDVEEDLISKEIETVKQKAVNLQSIFSHKSVNPTEIEAALQEMDKAIGDVHSVEHLVRFGVEHLGGKVTRKGAGWEVALANLPAHLKNELNGRENVRVSFDSPTPEGFIYLGRNHRFVDLLCQFLLALSVGSRGDYNPVARASVISTAEVAKRTVIYFLRLRSVVKESKTGQQNITEEVNLWGIQGSGENKKVLDNELCKKLLFEAQSDSGLPLPRQEQELSIYLDSLDGMQADIKQVAQARAQHQVEMHSQFSDLVGGKSYEAVHPVLPPDVLGIYLFLPKV